MLNDHRTLTWWLSGWLKHFFKMSLSHSKSNLLHVVFSVFRRVEILRSTIPSTSASQVAQGISALPFNPCGWRFKSNHRQSLHFKDHWRRSFHVAQHRRKTSLNPAEEDGSILLTAEFHLWNLKHQSVALGLELPTWRPLCFCTELLGSSENLLLWTDVYWFCGHVEILPSVTLTQANQANRTLSSFSFRLIYVFFLHSKLTNAGFYHEDYWLFQVDFQPL